MSSISVSRAHRIGRSPADQNRLLVVEVEVAKLYVDGEAAGLGSL